MNNEVVIVRYKHISGKTYRLARLYHVDLVREIAIYIDNVGYTNLDVVKRVAREHGFPTPRRMFETNYALTCVDNVKLCERSRQ